VSFKGVESGISEENIWELMSQVWNQGEVLQRAYWNVMLFGWVKITKEFTQAEGSLIPAAT
jgi:hypothetical protein